MLLYTLVYSLWCIVLISVFNKCENITTNLHENYWSFFIKKKYWNLQFSVKNCRKLLSFWFEWNFITVIVMILFIVPSVNILFVKIPSTYVAVVIDTEILLLMLWLLLSKILFYLVQHIKFKITHVFCLKNTYHIFWLQYTYEFLVAAIYCIYKWICWPNQ